MTKLNKFIAELRELATKAPLTIVSIPSDCEGLAAGGFKLSSLLECIARNLEGKHPVCHKGVPHDNRP